MKIRFKAILLGIVAIIFGACGSKQNDVQPQNEEPNIEQSDNNEEYFWSFPLNGNDSTFITDGEWHEISPFSIPPRIVHRGDSGKVTVDSESGTSTTFCKTGELMRNDSIAIMILYAHASLYNELKEAKYLTYFGFEGKDFGKEKIKENNLDGSDFHHPILPGAVLVVEGQIQRVSLYHAKKCSPEDFVSVMVQVNKAWRRAKPTTK